MPRPRATALAARRARIGLFLLAGALLAACTAGPSTRPAVVVQGGPGNEEATTNAPDHGPALPGLEKPRSAQVPWSDCTPATRQRLGPDAASVGSAKFQCAQLIGSAEPPIPPTASLARISVLKAGNGPIPLVVLNDADGVPGSLYAAELASRLPKEVTSRFSLIGVDRRGTGESDPVRCVPQNVRSEILGFDPADRRLDGLLEATRDATQQCTIALDNRLQTFNTNNTIGDLTLLREGLGVQRLNALGHGEGSRVLAAFAARHPGQVGRFVLDGLPDPTAEVQSRTEGQVAGAEAAFDAFAEQCAATSCPLGSSPRNAVDQLLSSLRARPLRTADGIELTPGLAVNAVLAGLDDTSRWRELASALAAARSGSAEALVTFIRPSLVDSIYESARFDSGLATGCNDDEDRLPPERVNAAYRDWAGKYPLFGGRFAQRLLVCSPWPIPSQPLATPTTSKAPPILVLATASDPVTPGEGTQRAAQQLSGSVLVSWQGAGHGAVPASDCAVLRVREFLVNGRIPASGTSCPG